MLVIVSASQFVRQSSILLSNCMIFQIKVFVCDDGNKSVFATLGVTQCEGLERIHVDEYTVLWYTL